MNAPTDQRVVEATVESVLFKEGVKVVLTLVNGSGARALAALVGHTVEIGLTGVAPARDPAQGALALTEPWRAPDETVTRSETEPGQIGLVGGEETLTVTQTSESTEPYVAERDYAFLIVVGKDETPYPGAPSSFKTALRAETWLQSHLEEQAGALVKDALEAFRQEGMAEAKKPEDERRWDEAFERASRRCPGPTFVAENYAELSAALAEGWDKALD